MNKVNKKNFYCNVKIAHSSQMGGALMYVLILTAVGSSVVAYLSSRVDQYRVSTTQVEKAAFVSEVLKSFNNSLVCPGGVLGVRRGTCSHKFNSLTLSIPQLRRIAMGAVPNSLTTTGGYPASGRAYDYFDIIHLRLICYRQGSHLDASGWPMKTSKDKRPCETLANVDKVLTPLIGQHLINGNEDSFVNDTRAIEGSIYPEINKEIAKAQAEIARLTPPQTVAYNNYITYYQAYVAAANACAAAAAMEVACDPGTVAQLYWASSQMSYWYGEYARLTQLINIENRRIQSYYAMSGFLHSITDGKHLVLRNSQLAVLQAQGGTLAALLRHGAGGAAYKALRSLPGLDNNGLSSTQTAAYGIDDFNFGLLKLRPYCAKPNGQAKLQFFAKVTDATSVANGNVKVQLDFQRRKQKIAEVLEMAGEGLANWRILPATFTPTDCKIIEEDDPPVSGPNNWRMDSLVNKSP